MINYRKLAMTTIALTCLSLGAPTVSVAQDAGFGLTKQEPVFRTVAGFHLSIPFGAKAKQEMYKPRLGFAINMERQLNERGYGVPLRAKINALDFGFGFDGRPIMIVGGQDVYTPIFRPDEVAYIAGAGTSRNTFLIIAGGVLATGAIVALASSSNGNGNDRDSNGRDRDGDSDDNG